MWRMEMRLVSEGQRTDFAPFLHRPKMRLGLGSIIVGGDREQRDKQVFYSLFRG